MYKYKIEIWNKTKWKGTARETTTTVEKLVKRDSKGHFIKGSPIITEIQEKSYGSGIYKVGIKKGKIVTRSKIAEKTPEWYEKRKEFLAKGRKIYRTSYVLNDIPFRGNVYYGFRIVAFSHNEQLLKELRSKLKERLIEFIEDCLGYKSDEFWFNMYFGYEAPTVNNAYGSDNGRYYLMWQKRYGTTIKQESHYLGDL